MADAPYEDLPEDAELIFLRLEQAFRNQCGEAMERSLERFGHEYNPRSECLTYMRQVRALAAELDIREIAELDVPAAINFSFEQYEDFRGEVDACRTTLMVRHGRRIQGYSVRFDQKTKLKITHHIQSIREIILALEIDDWKRETLLRCLNNLQLEVDKDRSKYEVFGALVVETAGILGTAGEKLEPVRKIIDSVAALIWGAHHAEVTLKLEPPRPRRQIEPPKTRPKAKPFDDDEIPF